MKWRGLAELLVVGVALALVGCGGGSGRQGTDLQVSGTGPAAPVQGGSDASFVMTVRNAGENEATDVAVTNQIGNQFGAPTLTCTAAGGATCPDQPTVSMTIARLPAGGSLVFTVTATLNANASGTVSNTMSVRYDGTETDGSNNTSRVEATAFSVVSNLVVSGTGPGGSVTSGSTAVFQMTVRNDGPDTATGLKLTNNTGSFLVLTGITCSASPGASCPAAPGAVMELASLPAGGVLTFNVNTTVFTILNGTVTNTLQVTADTDNNRNDNSFTATANVVTASSGLFVTGVGPAAVVSGGGTAQFVMTVSNAGPDAATTVNIVNTVGSNLTLTGVSCAASGGAVCPATLGPVMSLASMPAGGSLGFTVSAFVAAGTSGSLTNTMSVGADNDSNRADNTATAVGTAATPRASLVVTGTGPAATVAGGEVAIFTTTVANAGPDATTDLRVVHAVGSNLSFVGASCTASGGATCPAAVGVVTDVGMLPAGGQLNFSVAALVAAGTNGAITTTVQATASNAFNPSGNTAVAVGTAFTARSNLAISGSGPSNAPAGGPGSFVLTLVNNGPQAAETVRLVNTLGSNLTLSSFNCTASGGATCPATPGPVMDVANLPVDGSLRFDIGVQIAAGTQGALIDTLVATVTSGTRTEITGVAVGSAYSTSVGVTASGPSGPLIGGTTTSFVMGVANSGPGTAVDVALTNLLSSGLGSAGAISCVAQGGAVCPAAPGATMVVPSMPSGSALTFNVPVTVDAGFNGVVSSTMTAAAAGDVRANDNTASASFTALSVDLGVTQSGATEITAGSTAVFTATVANPGPGTANNLVLSHALSGAVTSGASLICTPSSGATCPAVLGPDMTLASLPSGRSLTFTVTLPVPEAARGDIVSRFTVASDGDANPANNTASVTTRAIDARNGSYRVFAADGHAYTLNIDFDAGSYTITGGNQVMQRSFTRDGDGKGYTVAGGVRFRTSTDLVVGGHDFAGGTLPYVAARSFGSSVNELVGSYNLLVRDVPLVGAVSQHAAVVTVTGNVLSVCQTDDGSIRQPGTNCTNAGKQRNYVLTVADGFFVATEVGGSDQFSLLLARTGASKLLLGTTAAGADGKLRLALQDAATLIGGTVAGASSSGGWVDPIVLTGVTYNSAGAAADTDTASLTAVTGTGVGAMLRGLRTSDGQTFWVMQSSPLVVGFGDFLAIGAAAGLLHIALP